MTTVPRTLPRLLPTRLPRVCAAVIGSSPAELIERAEAVVRDNPFVELRLDYLKVPGSAFPKIKAFIDFHPEVLVIATCRRAVNGGKFRGSAASQAEILIRAAQQGCQLIDFEFPSARQLKPEQYDKLRGAAALILSFHDFHATKKLDETFAKMKAFPADFYKLVSTAKTLSDNVVMMKFLEREGQKHSLVGLCMGEQGIISRVLGVRAGSAFTFGAATPGEETAPGQIAVKTLHDVYRIELVDAATRVYGVAGDPVAHSLSPQMMNAAFRRENVNAVYLALHAKTIKDLLVLVRDIPISGMSVTMPYKEEFLKYLENTTPIVDQVGAVNTVVRAQDGKLYGFNTDVSGVVRPLEQRFPLMGSKVLVIGAGGAARAAVYGLKERGVEVHITNRTPAAGKKLARSARAKFVSRSDLKKLSFDAIVNATPVGMGGGSATPLTEKELNARYLLEMVYNPADTKLTKIARAKGIAVIPGIEMFIHQGARQFEIWTGKPAPAAEMAFIVKTQLEALAAAAAKEKGGAKKKRR